jgi:hypothetical protein
LARTLIYSGPYAALDVPAVSARAVPGQPFPVDDDAVAAGLLQSVEWAEYQPKTPAKTTGTTEGSAP